MDEAIPQIAVGAIVVSEGKLLMIKRAKDPGAGLWTVPGGRLERGEHLKDAVRREVLEETGVEVEVGDLLGILEVVGDPHYVILDHLAEPVGQGDPTASSDASEVRWVPLEEVGGLECTPRFVETMTAWGVLSNPS